MQFVNKSDFYGVEVKEIPCILLKGSPTPKTEGAVGLLGMNENTGDIYKCISVNGNSFLWKLCVEGHALDSSLSDPNASAPAGVVGEKLKSKLGVYYIEIHRLDNEDGSSTYTFGKDCNFKWDDFIRLAKEKQTEVVCREYSVSESLKVNSEEYYSYKLYWVDSLSRRAYFCCIDESGHVRFLSIGDESIQEETYSFVKSVNGLKPDSDGNVNTSDSERNAKEYYYSSLAQALDDASNSQYSNSVEAEAAKIKITVADIITVSLLEDIEEGERVRINNPTELNLNGKTIGLINNASFIVNSKLTVNGDGLITQTIETANSNYSMFQAMNAELVINGGEYKSFRHDDNGLVSMFYILGKGEINNANCYLHASNATGNVDGIIAAGEFYFNNSTLGVQAMSGSAIGIYNTKEAFIKGSNIVTNANSDTDNKRSRGIDNRGVLRITDSKVVADACGGNADNDCSVGIANYGTCYCVNTDVDGTISGLQNGKDAKAYIQGGTFTGYTHGGFYLCHGINGEAFIRDATTRCGNYTGIHSDIISNCEKLAHMYIGGGENENNSNITAYLDGCTFGNADTRTSYGDMVLRGTSGEEGHIINVSNCTFTANRVRIDRKSMTFNMGNGNIYTDIVFTSNDNAQDRVFYTDKVYRKYEADEELNGADFNKIVGMLNSRKVSVADTKDGVYFVPIKYDGIKYSYDGIAFADVEAAYNEGKYLVLKVTYNNAVNFAGCIKRIYTESYGMTQYIFANSIGENPQGKGAYNILHLDSGADLINWTTLDSTSSKQVVCDVTIGDTKYTNLEAALEAVAAALSKSES